eukprot:scaffold3806_cov169-Amphora_coffeaeformis.AAC.7
MAAEKVSPLLAFYKFVASGNIAGDKEGTDEEKASLLDLDPSDPTTRQHYHSDDDKNVVKKKKEAERDDDSRTPLGGIVQWYQGMLDKKPLLVKAVTAFFILGLGDAAAQGVEHIRGSHPHVRFDIFRALRFGVFGFLGTPWAHYYYFFMDKCFPPTEKPFSFVTALKLFIDQGIQAPTLLAVIISLLAVLKGNGLAGIQSDMKANYMHTLIANCTYEYDREKYTMLLVI